MPRELPVYQVDAFTSEVFGGNPAAVCPLDQWLPDEVMQAIAESYDVLRHVGSRSPSEIGEVFADWASADLGGYLMQISGEILQMDDLATGRPIIDVIVDEAHHSVAASYRRVLTHVGSFALDGCLKMISGRLNRLGTE